MMVQQYQHARHPVYFKIQNTATVDHLCIPWHNSIPSSSVELPAIVNLGFVIPMDLILFLHVCMPKQYVSPSCMFLNLI